MSSTVQESGNRIAEGWARIILGDTLKDQDLFAEAASHYQACLEGSTDNTVGMALAQLNLGDLAMLHGHCTEARQLLSESLNRFDKSGIRWGVILALENLGCLACEQGEYRSALEHFRRAFQDSLTINTSRFVGSTAAGVALILARTDRVLLAVELLGLAKIHPSTELFTHKRRIAPLLGELSSKLSEADFSAALERGKALDLGSVLDGLSL